MDGIKEQLSDKQLRVIPHLLASPSIEEGCKSAKVGKATLYEWLKNETFKGEIRRQRQEIVQAALEGLKSNISKATEVLVGLLDSENEGIKYRAAKDIVEFTQKAIEFEDLERRIGAIEEQIEQRRGRRGH